MIIRDIIYDFIGFFVFLEPGLKARGKRKINKATISIRFIILIFKYF